MGEEAKTQGKRKRAKNRKEFWIILKLAKNQLHLTNWLIFCEKSRDNKFQKNWTTSQPDKPEVAFRVVVQMKNGAA